MDRQTLKNNHSAMILGAKLKAHFKSAGISQQELAKDLDTKQSWISRIYSGEFTNRSDIARALCERANIPFLLDIETSEGKDAKMYKLAAELALMESDDVKAIRKIFGILQQVR